MLNIPTTKELYEAILQDLQDELGGSIPVWRKAFIKVLAGVQAAKLHLEYLVAGNVQRNVFPDLADSESVGGTLERFGRGKLGRGPKPPTQGLYLVRVTGTMGATIPVSTTFKSTDTSANPNVLYILDSSIVLTSSTEDIELRCLTAGVGGRLSVGDTLTVTAPLANLDNSAVVIGELVVPNAGETIEEYRKAVLASYRLLPQGGAPADYRLWAQYADGVLEVYPYSKTAAPGEVIVFVEASKIDSTDGKGTPTATILNAAESVLLADPVTSRGRLPLGVVALNVVPVVVVDVAIQIPSFAGLTAHKQAIITAALHEMVNEVRPFIGGADVLAAKNDTISVNTIVAKVLEVVPGSSFAAPIITVTRPSAAPVTVITQTFDYGDIPYLTAVFYV